MTTRKSTLKYSSHLKWIVLLFPIFFGGQFTADAQEVAPAYQEGEWFKFRVHYGLVTAGYATLKVENSIYKDKSVYHVRALEKQLAFLDFSLR